MIFGHNLTGFRQASERNAVDAAEKELDRMIERRSPKGDVDPLQPEGAR
jgi:hypothetical protein